MGTARLHRLSKIGGKESAIKDRQGSFFTYKGRERGWNILFEAQQHWLAMETFRRDRKRNKDYYFGKQWEDEIEVDGRMIKESDYIRNEGNIPLKNNLIRRMVSAVLGVYRSQSKEPMCTARDRDEQQYGETMSTVLQYNMQLNKMQEVYARGMEEFMISGFVVQRKWYGWRNEKLDCWTDHVQPNNFFIDSNMRDFRGWDVSCLGEIHDIDFKELCQRFAKTPEDCIKLGEIYKEASDKNHLSTTFEDFGYPLGGRTDFFVPEDLTRCRVIEVWRKESKPRYRCHDLNNGDVFKVEVEDFEEFIGRVNRERLAQGASYGIPEDEIPMIRYEWFMDSYWYYYLMTPFGDILEEGETPYDHKSHPYVFKAYPFIDGEIHSFVSNIIDQQRYVNRLITMYDWIMRASAKGLLMIPEDTIPEDMSIEDMAEEWTRFNGVIVYKPSSKHSQMPHQVANNSTQIGITELLNMQLKFFEDISGVNGAIQGKPGFSGMSASLYSQQTQNATTSLLDLLDSFSAFVVEGATKDVKNIQQYYDSPRVFNIAGRGANLVEYDPKKIRDVEFDLSIAESTATPQYRAIANDFLMQLFNQGAITVEMLLENGDFPYADRLLQSIQAQRQTLEAQAQAQAG